jgi:hypothetical protein
LSSKHVLNKHFEDLLLHPTFNPPKAPVHSQHSPETAFAIFQRHLARGTVNVNHIEACLKVISLAPSTTKTISLGVKLVSLLQSSNQISLRDASKSRLARHHLMAILVNEDRHELARKIIQDLENPAFLASYLQLCIRERGLEFAISAAGRLLPDIKSNIIPGIIAIPKHLLQHPPDVAEVSKEVYNAMMKVTKDLLSRSQSSYSIFTYSTLALLNPTASNPKPALEFVRSLIQNPEVFEIWSIPQNRTLRTLSLQLILKLSEVLINQEDYQNAGEVLSFAQATFPEELGRVKPTTKHTTEKVSSRNESTLLGRLDGLLST